MPGGVGVGFRYVNFFKRIVGKQNPSWNEVVDRPTQPTDYHAMIIPLLLRKLHKVNGMRHAYY